jgi:hypothetical protein
MRLLLLLYPVRWRRRYGDELSRLLDDLEPAPLRVRLATAVDLMHGAFDAHLTGEFRMNPATRAAVGRGAIVALVVWVALSVEIVLSNVVFPSGGDNDGLSVLISYLGVFAALAFTGRLAARTATDWRGLAAAGATAGALIGALTVATFFVVDNVFLDIVSRQQTKIDGLAGSGMTSMRAYINDGLLLSLAALTIFFGAAGAGLGVVGGVVTRARRADRPERAS